MTNIIFIAFVSLFCLNGRGLGGPVSGRRGMLISDYLQELSSKCTNAFLASEIAKALENCSIKSPLVEKGDSLAEKQLLCLMYYDINSQLCRSTLVETDFVKKFGQDVTMKDFCTESAHWTVPQIDWYSPYKSTLEGLFKDTYSCSSLCHDPNRFHYVNNICKLYKVGYDLLHEIKPVTSTGEGTKEETNKKLPLAVSDSNENEPPPVLHRDTSPSDILTRKALEDVYMNRNVTIPSTLLRPANEIKLDTTTKQQLTENQINSLGKIEPAVNLPLNTEEQEIANKVAKVRAMAQIVPLQNELAQPLITTKKTNEDQSESKILQAADDEPKEPNVPQDNQDNVEDIVSKPELNQEKGVKNPSLVVQPVPEKGKVQQEDIDNWGEPPQEKDDDEQDKDDDAALADDETDESEFDEPKKPEVKPEQKSEHPHVSQKLPDTMQKAKFPNLPEYPSEDEDHFFSFFLTVIVLVALLYVLYHNKSRVTKVVLGLIVEGRQTGRRRNSRGHAYRRLDTLEQAMSASTTAPPSKIIY